MAEKYYESRIKCDVLNALRKRGIIDSRSIVASEYVLGSTGRRADLAIYNGSRLIGIEIKSKHDSLARLKPQLSVYTACFDEVILVSDEKHLTSITDAVPPEVSIFTVSESGSIIIWREALVPATRTKSVSLKLLTMSDLKKLVGVPIGAPVKKAALLTAAQELSDKLIFESVTTSFVQTFSETSTKFWEHVGGRNVSHRGLLHLSRFAPERINVIQKKEKQQLFWELWRHQAKETLQIASS
ncbi:MAG: sce7726 family protein [Mesorhizobium sp.]|uniref:sce7726 family protein n=1 Tax=Mesorhizobium sp. TaxID=1871066 RepID=UPI001206A787|nr:sce7726 family protein [Mesorhizobium sp.]TIL24583.1 MAG: sce7726 family protein [Mesorhizobium sp.]